MYPMLRAEMAKKRITLTDLSVVLDCTPTTMSMKLNGKSPLQFDEAVKIKEYVKTDMPLDALFARVETTVVK